MSIIVCGINHKTANIALREQVFFAQDKLPIYLQDILHNNIAAEVVLLSTCNRSEIYCEAHDAAQVIAWFCAFHPDVAAAMYCYHGGQAVEHLMQVACGIDSMVLGEAEILGQVKAAFAESCSANAVGNAFHRLFQQVFSLAKEIRTTTAIGACPVSIASTTVSLAKSLVDLPNCNLVLLGAGEMMALVLRYLSPNVANNTWLLTRQLVKAYKLANTYRINAAPLSSLPELLSTAHVVITATASIKPLINVDLVRRVLAKRQQPLYIFDVAVPRDVEEAVGLLPMVNLYCIDDLKAIIQENQNNRQHAAQKAVLAIQQRAQAFMAQYTSLEQVSATIRAYRQQIEAVCEEELHKALQHLWQANHAIAIDKSVTEQILRNFAHSLTQKLLHAPSVNLRQVGYEGRLDLLSLAKKILSIPELDSQTL
jgi:glutamyl-tRNA reductase